MTGVSLDDGQTTGHIDDGDTAVAEYRYDGLGRRITKLLFDRQAGTWTRTDYLYNDRWQVMEERRDMYATYESASTTVATHPHAQYVWDVGYVDAPLCRLRDADGYVGSGLEEVVYYLTDGNHNVTAFVNSSGEVLERHLYDAYGSVRVLNGDPAVDPDRDDEGDPLPEWTPDPDNVSDVGNEVLFAGYRYDRETGMYHVRNRSYHPLLGTWTSRDPEGYVDGMNLYQYCRSGPANATDPMGTEGWSDPPRTIRLQSGRLCVQRITYGYR